MRRTILLPSLAALALAVAACASGGGPTWTYAPPTPAPASQPPASDAPSGPPASEAPAGNVVAISALGIAYEQAEASAPADTSFVIRFENKDAGIPHNVEIKDAAGMTVFKGDIFNGVETREYTVDPLPAGTYQFVCTVHPNMVGTLKVGG